MRAALEKWLTDIWYNNTQPPLLLRTLEAIYRRTIPASSSTDKGGSSPIPVVVIGNLTAGGTGKTPLVIALCKQLLAAGLQPGVISRGYGRKSKGLHIVAPDDNPAASGDESLLLKIETGVPVILAEDRRLAITAMEKQAVDVIIADDGLQNKHLPRDIEICLVDGDRQFGNQHLLPAGPLRESLDRLQTVDYVVINGNKSSLDEFLRLGNKLELSISELVLMSLAVSKLEPLDRSTNSVVNINDWQGRKVHAVAAIGNPQRFAATLKTMGIEPELHAFPDHHQYAIGDFSRLCQYPIILTAKDAVKCRQLGLDNAWVLSVVADIDAGFWEVLIRDIQRLIKNRLEVSA